MEKFINVMEKRPELKIPDSERRLLLALEKLGGKGSATAIRQAANDCISQAAVHVFALRLVQKGLVKRTETKIDFEGETIKRITYSLNSTNSQLGEDSNGWQSYGVVS